MTTFRLSRQSSEQVRSRVVAVFCAAGDKAPGGLPAGPLRNALRQAMSIEGFTGDEGEMLLWHAPAGSRAPRYLVVGTGKKKETDLETVRRVFARLARRFDKGLESLAAELPEAGDATTAARVQAAVEGTLLGGHHWKAYISDKDDKKKGGKAKKKSGSASGIATVTLLGASGKTAEQAVRRGERGSRATILARELVCEPPSSMTPRAMEKRARAVARDAGLKITVYDQKKLESMGFGCFLGVARGSTEPPRFIHLIYTPSRRTRKTKRVALVGKGITFDSGGLSLKPAPSMETMKSDMAGSAAVLATLSALKSIGCRHEVHGLLMMTENMPSGSAYKPGDILRSFSGKTVEVLNTDAEGRLALADGLEFAKTLEPDAIIDVATLTGACVVALGTLCSGVMGFDRKLVQAIVDAGDEAGEKLWPLPFFTEYRRGLDSKVADIKHIGGRWGGALTAGLFLGEFVGETIPWAHLDIAGPAFTEQDLPLARVGGTGHPVRTLLRYLETLN